MVGANKSDINSKGQTALHLAARSRNLREVKRLLSLGAEVDTRDKKDRTPLHLAASWNRNQTHYCTIQVLLENGADVNALDVDRKTPFHYLVGRANINMIKLFLNFKANFNTISESGDSSVGSAVCRRNTEVLRLLLDHGLDIKSSKYNFGYTLLHLAVNYNRGDSHFDIIEILLKHGADVNAQDEDGNTPFHFLFYGSIDEKIVKLFLESKVKVNLQDNAGETPLFLAISKDNFEIVQLLMDHGASVNRVSHIGSMPLYQAFMCTHNNQVKIVKCLLKNGANVHARDSGLEKLGDFFNEMKMNHSFLLKYVNINVVDSRDQNILHYTSARENQKIILKQLAKLEVLGVCLHDKILETISENRAYNNYFTECTEELKKAKSIKLQNCWVTFFNLLVDSRRELKNYAGNADLIREFENSGCLNKFPNYGALMKKNVDKGIKVRKLFDKSAVVLSDLLSIFNPTHLIIRDILDCLSWKDYDKLVF